jgi:hexosaminidase
MPVYLSFADDLSRHFPISLVCGEQTEHDGAQHSYRGLMLDVARHFLDIATVQRILWHMSVVKLNVLHMHLADDQGWRVDVPSFPQLAKHGSRRGPNVNPRSSKYAAMNIRHYRDTPKRAYYSAEEVRSLTQLANVLHIMIIPEISFPAHAAALIRSSHSAPVNSSLRGLQGVVDLHEGCVEERDDLLRSFEAVNCMGGTHGMLLPTATTMEVFTRIIGEVADLFGECPYFHIGGDEGEIFRESAFRGKISELQVQFNTTNAAVIQAKAIARIAEFLSKEKNKTAIIWDDSLMHRDVVDQLTPQIGLDGNAVMMWWRDWHPQSRWPAVSKAPMLKILTPTTNTYFDAYQFQNHSKSRFPVQDGKVSVRDVLNLLKFLDATDRTAVLGVEGCLWSETLTDEDVVVYQLFPRIFALAEVGWRSPNSISRKENVSALLKSLRVRLADVQEVYIDIAGVPSWDEQFDEAEVERG